MVSIDKIKRLEKFKHDELKFKEEFFLLFIEVCQRNLSFFELDEIVQNIADNNEKEIYNKIEQWTEESKRRVLEAIEAGTPDEVYQSRYFKVKELSDLFTYYKEEMNIWI